jgi:opacity protein-like surface antigen
MTFGNLKRVCEISTHVSQWVEGALGSSIESTECELTAVRRRCLRCTLDWEEAMKRTLTVMVMLAGFLMAALTAQVHAWEFHMQTAHDWTYQYFDQSGKSGFFGPFNTPAPAGFGPAVANYTTMNFWAGSRYLNGRQFGLVTGQDAAINYTRMVLNPEFRVNPAIRIRGEYQIGNRESLNQAVPGGFIINSYPAAINSDFYGSHRTFADGQWSQLWVSAQTPWGIVVYGKREAPWGLGLQYDGDNADRESLLVVVPYGPFRFGADWFPARGANIAYDLATQFTVVNAHGFSRYPKEWDKDGIRSINGSAFLTYESGDLSVGILYDFITFHQGPQAGSVYGPAVAPTVADTRAQTITIDSAVEDGSVFLKYNNGRFFFNTELAFIRGQTHKQPPVTQNGVPTGAGLLPVPVVFAGQGDPMAQHDLESWKYMAEFGTICGPTKLSMLYARTPGPDRRHGIWINHQSWENIAGGLFLGNSRLYKPYSYLMSYQYGGGLNAVNSSGEGMMTDAETYGARLDYAVAANLNVFVTGFYANRLSHGWGWGSLVPTPSSSVGVYGVVDQFGLPFVTEAGTALSPLTIAWPNITQAPSIPDNNLGYEIGAGADWKLLENMTLHLLFAYWQPGNWFKYACIDKSLLGPADVAGQLGGLIPPGFVAPLATTGNAIGCGWGVNPNRSIDPVLAFNATLNVNF